MSNIERKSLHDAVVCNPSDSVLEVSKIMRDTQTRHIIVVDEDLKPLGIISPFDINNRVVAEEKDTMSVKASEIMTSPIETIDLSAEYKEAAEKMTSMETFTLPVTEDGKLVGILDFSVVFGNVCEVKNEDSNK